MKKLFSLSLLVMPLMLSTVSIAQSVQNTQNPQSVKNEPSAKSRLQQKLTQLQSYSANFSQTVTDAQHTLLQRSSGSIALLQPNKLYWQVNPPNENTLIADGTTLWHIDPFVEQVIALDQFDAVKNNPIVLLAEPQSDVWQNYTITQQGDSFSVVTSDETSQIAKLVFVFEQNKLIELDIYDRQEQLSKLVFSHIQQGQAVDNSLFKFTLPQGFSLDDQRNDPAGL